MQLWDKESPTVTLIREHYRDFGLEKWTNQKTSNLCSMMNCSVYELAALAGVFSRKEIRKYWIQNKWPAPVALHFVKLERFVEERIFKTKRTGLPERLEAFVLSRTLKREKEKDCNEPSDKSPTSLETAPK